MDARCRSPIDVSAALDILGRLSISEDSEWNVYDFPAKGSDQLMPDPYAFEEEDADACDPSLYDPILFTPAVSHPASPLLTSFALRDKPLPPPPRLSYSPVTPASTPSSSPRTSITPPQHSLPLPRSRPPSTSLPRTHTHVAFPSISSTLSLLSERESEVEKRSGVIVTETSETGSNRASTGTTILAHPPVRKSSTDALKDLAAMDDSPKRKMRPNLTLASSTSTPQLRELAELAHTPASPILMHQPSLASLATSLTSPPESSVNLLPAVSLKPPASRWSMDSTDPTGMERRALSKPSPESPQASPVKPRKRDRLMSFISRARAGSVTKQPTSPTREDFDLPTPQSSQFGSLSSLPRMSTGTGSKRTSRSVYAPHGQQAAVTPSTASTSSASDTSLVTPGASQPDVSTIQEHVLSVDVFGTASPTFTPPSFVPDMCDNTDVSIIDDLYEPVPLEPTLPPPAPGTSTPSFFLPPKQEGLFASFARKTVRRRKKKLIVSWMAAPVPSTDDYGRSQIAAAREREQSLREDALLRWCESFGVVRRFERRENGDIHVYWKEWEVADTVCRLSANVDIRGVGRVGLSWRYVN